MPSSNKKKGRGKDKKNKSKPKPVARLWEVWAEGDVKGNKAEFPRPYVKCTHGCDIIPPQDHPIAKLLNSFEDEIELSPSYSVRSLIGASFYGHEDVWNDDELRQQAIDLFLCMGTNMCNARRSPTITRFAAVIALCLVNYDGDINTTFIISDPKIRDLTDCDNNCVSRDVVKFFKKNIPCKCLDQRYASSKNANNPKNGVCKTCRATMERSSLRVCSKCRLAHYCSRQCQIDDWPVHKNDCLIQRAIRGGETEQFKKMFTAFIPRPTNWKERK